MLQNGLPVTDVLQLTALHHLVLAWLARCSPERPDDIAEGLGLPVSLVRALVADLELAELVATDRQP